MLAREWESNLRLDKPRVRIDDNQIFQLSLEINPKQSFWQPQVSA